MSLDQFLTLISAIERKDVTAESLLKAVEFRFTEEPITFGVHSRWKICILNLGSLADRLPTLADYATGKPLYLERSDYQSAAETVLIHISEVLIPF